LEGGKGCKALPILTQYYPVVLRWPVTRLLASPTLFPLGAKLYNKFGDRFMAQLP
jgi:succinate dehydrogenase/fumarate reductase flavoprotein subunit